MTNKLMTLIRKRSFLLLAISAISAVFAAKTGGVHPFGFWDGAG